MLIHIGSHKNIVNLLGACTKGTKQEIYDVGPLPKVSQFSFAEAGRKAYRAMNPANSVFWDRL